MIDLVIEGVASDGRVPTLPDWLLKDGADPPAIFLATIRLVAGPAFQDLTYPTVLDLWMCGCCGLISCLDQARQRSIPYDVMVSAFAEARAIDRLRGFFRLGGRHSNN